jgi:hypothetical protein
LKEFKRNSLNGLDKGDDNIHETENHLSNYNMTQIMDYCKEEIANKEKK